MKMPKKKEWKDHLTNDKLIREYEGYNQGREDMLAYHNWRMGRLPSRQDIWLRLSEADINTILQEFKDGNINMNPVRDAIATAIDKRNKNENI